MKDIKGINLKHPLYVELDMRTSFMSKEDIMKWSIKCMNLVSRRWMKDLAHDNLIILAFQTMDDYLIDKISLSEAREVALKLHERARIETEKPIIFYHRALGQMVSIIHVKTHAMGHIYYTLKLLIAMELDMVDDYLSETREILNDIEGSTS